LKAIQYICDLHVKNSGNERDLPAQNGTRDGTQKSAEKNREQEGQEAIKTVETHNLDDNLGQREADARFLICRCN